jgi:ribosome production factor 2
MGKKLKVKAAKEKKIAAAKRDSKKKALDLGLSDKSHLIKKATTHKGRKQLEKKAPQLVEGVKSAIFVKGQKASNIVQAFMRDLIQMRGDPEVSRVYMRTGHDMHPLENIVPLESMASKNDCGLFVFGNSQKKRPDNIVFGRTYDGKSLDLFEVGIENYKGIVDFAVADIPRDLKPVILFQGEHFEFSEKHQRIKSIFYELFRQRDLKEANITELKRLLVFTSVDDATI